MMNLYRELPLSWTVEPPVVDFDESTFVRKEWGPGDSETFVEDGGLTANLDTMEMILSTMSPVQRWREANPAVVGTEKDVVRMMRIEIERLSYEADVEVGTVVVKGSLTGVLLMFKKKP